MEPPKDLSPSDAARLAELEERWEAEFTQHPKLPSAAMLLAGLSMALGFCGVLFFMTHWLHRYFWIPLSLSIFFAIVSRRISKRWFSVVQSWSAARESAKEELQALRQKQKSTA